MSKLAALWLEGGAGLNPMPTAGSGNAALNPMERPAQWTPPMVADAVRLMQAALAADGDKPTRHKPLLRGPEQPRDAREGQASVASAGTNIWRWSPAARLDACQFELVSGLAFEDGALENKQHGSGNASLIKFWPTPADWTTQFEWQAAKTLEQAEVRAERMSEILVQESALWPFWTAITHLQPAQVPKTAELVEAAMTLASMTVLRIKHFVGCPRPADVSPAIQPMIQTPGHGSLPSGHATGAYMFAVLMDGLMGWDAANKDPMRVQLWRLAHRIAENREVAGVHFPMDSVAGRLLGQTLANYFISRCTGEERDFAGAEFLLGSPQPLTKPEEVQLPVDVLAGLGRDQACIPADKAKAEKALLISQVWDAAKRELQQLGFL